MRRTCHHAREVRVQPIGVDLLVFESLQHCGSLNPTRTGTPTDLAKEKAGTLARAERVSPEVAQYLNRLSDLLFVLARVLARHEHGVEVLWRHDRGKAK